MAPVNSLHWKSYVIEAWALGMFMISACCFVIVFEHPDSYLNSLIPSNVIRRMCIGAAMGLTAIALIYSKWGMQSGAHMNPAVTLANYRLNRISLADAFGYILFQFAGATLAMMILKILIGPYMAHPSVNFIITQPGRSGIAAAGIAEFLMSFIMFSTVMILSNTKRAKYTGYFAGVLVFIFISVEAPISGMSINPARSFAAAVAAGKWDSFWIYILAPIAGMQLSAIFSRNIYFRMFGQCRTMNCFMSGGKHTNEVYHVYSWWHTTKHGKAVLEDLSVQPKSPEIRAHLKITKP